LQETIDSLKRLAENSTGPAESANSQYPSAQANLDLMKSKTDKPYISENTVVSDLANGIVKKINVQKGTVLSGTAQNVIVTD
jgi:hypothetical protein